MSADRSKDDMISYMKESHGNWLAVEHDSAVAKATSPTPMGGVRLPVYA